MSFNGLIEQPAGGFTPSQLSETTLLRDITPQQWTDLGFREQTGIWSGFAARHDWNLRYDQSEQSPVLEGFGRERVDDGIHMPRSLLLHQTKTVGQLRHLISGLVQALPSTDTRGSAEM